MSPRAGRRAGSRFPTRGRTTASARSAHRLVYSPDGTIVAATSTRDGLIFLLDVASGRELGRLDGPASRFKALAFSPDGKILATGVDIDQRFPTRELAIRLWDVAARKELGRVKAHRGEHQRPGLLARRQAARLGERGCHGPGVGRGRAHPAAEDTCRPRSPSTRREPASANKSIGRRRVDLRYLFYVDRFESAG